MSIDLKKARDFVYGHGVLWEQALFAYRFQNGSLERLHQCWLCYKNPDGGWAHGLEHDIKTPDSHPLALEFLLTVTREMAVPVGNILDGTPQWLEAHRNADGSFQNPASVLDYPYAPWWNGGGQTIPASTVGNLTRLGLSSPALAESTRRWVAANLTLDKIAANEWIFMAYHAYDYFMNVADFPNVEAYRQVTITNIIACAERMPDKQTYQLFHYIYAPEAPITRHIPSKLVERGLDYLASTQRADGAWSDEHGLPQWESYVTILALWVLQNYGKLRA